MNKKNIKQIKRITKKDLTKYSLLKSIIKNLEKDYLSLAFSIWADPVPKAESENIFIDYYNSDKYKTNIKKYANEQEESLSGDYNFISNGKELENELKNQRKKHIFELEKNSFKRMLKNENENKLKESHNSLRFNKSENIYKKKEIKKSKINRNIIPNTYKIKLSDIQNNFQNNNQNNNKTEIIEPYAKKQNEGRRVSALLDISTEKENTEFDEEKSNDKSKNNKLKKEDKIRPLKEKNNKELSLNHIKNRNSSELGRKLGNIKYKKLFFSVDSESTNYLNKNNAIDLIPLKKIINNLQLKLSKFTKLYFNKWYIETKNYNFKNERKYKSKKELYLVNYQDNINENEGKNEDLDKQRKYNQDKKYKKHFKSIISPLGNHNKINEDINNSHSSKELNPYISNRSKRKHHNSIGYEEENILFHSKENLFNTEAKVISPQSLQKSQELSLKVKKRKKLVKKKEPNLNIITPFTYVDDPTNPDKINIQKSTNLTNFYDFIPQKSKSSKNKKEKENSFVNNYFKSRDINYAKEDINPDVVDIQIRQETETESEKTKNLAKMLKTGLHLLRKVIRSFQKRKTKGTLKDILKIYFNKWRKIIEKIPTRFNTEIKSFDKEKKEIYNDYMKTEPFYKNNMNTAYNNINFVKKIKNFNKINLIENYNTYIELNVKKDSKNFLDSDEDYNDKKIITKTIGIPNSDRGSITSIKELKKNKSNKNKIKVSRNPSMNEFNLAHSYDIITPKDKIHKSKRKSKAKNKLYNIIMNLIKKNEDNLLYKYLIIWYNMILNSFDYNYHHGKHKSKHSRSKKSLITNNQDKDQDINSVEEENRLSTEFRIRKNKKYSTEKRNEIKPSIKMYKEMKLNKKKKENDKYINGISELKNQCKKSMSLNNNVLNLLKICGNRNEGLSSINNYLKLIQSHNKLIAAYQIYSFYNINKNNLYIKLVRYYFYKWLKHNKIFKKTIKQENHIISKNKHCINCNCSKINLNCIDCHCNKIKKALRKILIRHKYMKQINLRRYYLYLWYKKSFKTIRTIL